MGLGSFMNHSDAGATVDHGYYVGRFAIFSALSDIEEGQELFYNYGIHYNWGRTGVGKRDVAASSGGGTDGHGPSTGWGGMLGSVRMRVFPFIWPEVLEMERTNSFREIAVDPIPQVPNFAFLGEGQNGVVNFRGKSSLAQKMSTFPFPSRKSLMPRLPIRGKMDTPTLQCTTRAREENSGARRSPSPAPEAR